jgi:hypothetical protein
MAKNGKILLSVTGFDPAVWRTELEKAAPERKVVEESAGPNDPDIEYAIVWKQRPGVLNGLPKLKAIFSIGAGVDHIFAEGDVPDVPIVRVVADDLTERMSEYVVWQVLDHHRKGPLYRDQQSRRIWHEDIMQPAAREVTVGILGYGNLGRDAAVKLRALGFGVIGWSRTAKDGEPIDTFAGEDGLDSFLALADIVVCLLTADAGDARHPVGAAVRQDEEARAARRTYPHQCRPRRIAEGSGYPRGAGRQAARRGVAGRVRKRAPACRQSAMDASAGDDHAACGGNLGAAGADPADDRADGCA